MAKIALALFLVALVGNAVAAPTASKITLALQKTLQTKSRVNIFITMAEGTQSVLDQVTQGVFATRGDRITAIYNSLNAHAAKSQQNLLAMLNSNLFFAIKVQSFWISNQVYVQGADQYLIESVAALNEVASIAEEEIVYLDESEAIPIEKGITAEWGIDKIQAPQAWAAGWNGNGAVVGVIDTGARHTHQDIRDNWVGGTHAWFNPYTQTQMPGDGHGHGTHVTGTAVGSGDIGVAPGARWISCKGLQDNGSGGQAQLTACGQYINCPHTYNGQQPDCRLAPDASSNSWGGGSGATWFDAVIRSWIASGIAPVFANGNSGPGCTTSGSPGDSGVVGTISVGATQASDAIASFSSRGPGPAGIQKPDVSAPGNPVRSAGHLSDTAYASMSGTSMACPHVAGLVALLRGKNPNISITEIINILRTTSDTNLVSGGQTCAGVPDTQFPNHTFGWGRINALRAVSA